MSGNWPWSPPPPKDYPPMPQVSNHLFLDHSPWKSTVSAESISYGFAISPNSIAFLVTMGFGEPLKLDARKSARDFQRTILVVGNAFSSVRVAVNCAMSRFKSCLFVRSLTKLNGEFVGSWAPVVSRLRKPGPSLINSPNCPDGVFFYERASLSMSRRGLSLIFISS